jgi:hypothetical protein
VLHSVSLKTMPARSIRHELERTAEEAAYLAVGLGVLAVRELRRRRRRASEPPPPASLLEEVADLAAPIAKEVRSAFDLLAKLARDAARRADGS